MNGKNILGENLSQTNYVYLFMSKHNQGMEGARRQYRVRWEDKVEIVVKAGSRALASSTFLHFLSLFSNLYLTIGFKCMQACLLSEILL